jgi:membrane-bound inhibitor of C-type lysozyme
MRLNARDNSIVYRHPTVLANGTLFVKGLESASGATGADGPTFMFVP